MTHRPARARRARRLAVALVAVPSFHAYGQNATPAPSDSALVRFLSAEVTRQMTELDVPGATVVLVRGGRVLMQASLGRASLGPSVAVDSGTTFRVASVAKVFTALAVLRLVESGRVALDADIRPLVADVPIRGPIRRPLTLRQLLTHTAGFDEQLIGYLNAAGAPAEPLGAYLHRSMPARSRVADDVPGYSNHGYALAGFVVERVTGIPFRDYVRDSVLHPLGMRSTLFVLDARDTVGIHLAAEYRSTGERREFRSSRAYPAGNLATTGADMARFLVALGSGLRGDSMSPISPAIARQLVGPVLTYHASLPGMGYGLSGVRVHGATVFVKGGASPSHSAVIAVVPAADVGVFIALNRQEPLLWDRVIPAFIARFFADSSAVTARTNPERATGPLGSVTGTYLWTRAPRESVESILGLGAQMRVTSADGGVRVEGPGEVAGEYAGRDSLLYEATDGRQIAFRMGRNGRATHLFSIIQGQPVSFERIGLTRTARVELGALLGATVLVLGAAVVAARARSGSTPRRWVRGAVIALPAIQVATVVIAIALIRTADRLQVGPTPLLRVALALCTLTIVVALVQVFATLGAALDPEKSLTARAVFAAGATGAVVLTWFLATNHLVGRW